MTDDPILTELRKIRKEIEMECEKNGETFGEHLRKVQKKFKGFVSIFKSKQCKEKSQEKKRKGFATETRSHGGK